MKRIAVVYLGVGPKPTSGRFCFAPAEWTSGGPPPGPGPPAGAGTVHLGLKGIQKTYPATEALVKVGEPCLRTVITKLASTESVNVMKACCGVLVGLRGRDSAVEILKEAIGKETEVNRRNRLQKCVDWLKQLKEDNI